MNLMMISRFTYFAKNVSSLIKIHRGYMIFSTNCYNSMYLFMTVANKTKRFAWTYIAQYAERFRVRGNRVGGSAEWKERERVKQWKTLNFNAFVVKI